MNDLETALAATLEGIADQSPRPSSPSLSPATLWEAGRRRRLRTAAVRAVGTLTVAATLLVAAGAVVGPLRGAKPVAVVPATLATPIEFRQVSAIDPNPCPATGGGLPGPEPAECYHVSTTGIDLTRVASLRVDHSATDEYWLTVRFVPDDAARFASLTRKLAALPRPASQLAIVVDGVVLTAPVVNEPITGGSAQITMRSASEADRLYRLLLPGTSRSGTSRSGTS